MAIVVTDNCRQCRFTGCVSVSLVACIHADHDMVYIDVAACIPVCRVNAIWVDEDLPEDKKHWLLINAEKVQSLPVLDDKQTPLPTSEKRRAELGL